MQSYTLSVDHTYNCQEIQTKYELDNICINQANNNINFACNDEYNIMHNTYSSQQIKLFSKNKISKGAIFLWLCALIIMYYISIKYFIMSILSLFNAYFNKIL